MTYDEEFQRDPLNFIRTHAIIPAHNVCEIGGNRIITGRFTLSDSRADGGGMARTVLVLKMVERPASGGFSFRNMFAKREGFDAYWLAYDEDDVNRTFLGTAAKYMFTAKLTGCSFGIGTRTANGGVLVSHANAATSGQQEEQTTGSVARAQRWQTRIQSLMLKDAHGDHLRIEVPPSSYRDARNDGTGDVTYEQASIIGIFLKGHWRFFMQRIHLFQGTSYVMKDVVFLG